ncbi:hypothetical protein Q7P37_008121 [Cladosporium fusiforme]
MESANELKTLLWLPTDPAAKNSTSTSTAHSKTLVRARAAAWSHQVGSRTIHRPAAKAWHNVRDLAPDHFGEFQVAETQHSPAIATRPQPCKKPRNKQPNPQPLLREPRLSGDELFGRQLHFVLPRFKAIAGAEGLDWLTRVSKRKDNVLLQGALKALISGLDTTSKITTTRRRCTEVLPSARLWLSDPASRKSHDTVLLLFLLSFHELLVWSNAKAWMMHVWGLSEIMRAQGPRNFTAPFALKTFCWFRHFAVALDILLRRRSYLEDADWMFEPWAEQGEKNMVDHAVDILVCVPGLIEKADLVLAGRESPMTLHTKASDLITGLHAWKSLHLDSYVLSNYSDITDFDELVGLIVDGKLVDAFLARAIVLHLSTWLLLTRFKMEAYLPWRAEEIVDNVLDICEEYSYHQAGAGIMPWTFAIRVALFTDLPRPPLSRGHELCTRLERHYSLNMMSDIIASLPGLNTKMRFDDADEGYGSRATSEE